LLLSGIQRCCFGLAAAAGPAAQRQKVVRRRFDLRSKKGKKRRSATKHTDTVVGVAWFDSDQWLRLREIAADPDRLEESYEEWLAVAEDAIRNLKVGGLTIEKVPVNTEELILWCNEDGRSIDAAARAEFAVRELRKRHQPQ
jgi:hypothetical protein